MFFHRRGDPGKVSVGLNCLKDCHVQEAANLGVESDGNKRAD